MTDEQKRALAIATARARLAQRQAGSATAPGDGSNPSAAQPGETVMDTLRRTGGQEGASAPMDMLNPVQGDPTGAAQVAETIQDNVIGLDNGVMSPGEKLATALNMGGESLTFGLVGDEAAAGADALIGRGGSYDENLTRYRDQERQFEGENPALALGARIAPAFLPGIGAGSFIGRAGSLRGAAARSGILGAVGGGTYGFMEGEGGLEDRLEDGYKTAALGGLIGGVIPYAGAAARALTGKGQRGANRAFAEGVETVDDLTAQASAKYDEARRLGIRATQEQTAGLADDITAIARREGVISPTGRVAESFPRIRDAIRMVEDFSEGTMTPEQMQAVRRTFQGAAASADGSERRLGTIMLNKFDEFIEPLAPQFREANSLYRRAANGKMIDEAVELAGVRAGQFTGSGFENALRVEFRRLSRDIVKGRLRGLTKDQSAAIRRIADGGSVENFMRGLGKLAPTGAVSAMAGGGMPFLIGNAMGGPMVGAAAGGLTMGAGALGRRIATGMQTGNANLAGGLLRSASGQLPRVAPAANPGLLGGLAGAGAVTAQQTQSRPQVNRAR